ncbi:hypothetical protein LCGC14_1096350 [marine sediment metagenome]|uniref:NTP pyrophosphohydrolase MazG-like domain-containing protein n=1 Tax=marine sediment metagenome TaxID=412755 RepID=A0A0F9MF86_9ZZZZ
MPQLKINECAESVKEYRERKGFDTNWEIMLAKLMLVVTEVSEAAEAHRKNDFENFTEEIADTFIRLMDITASLGIDIEKAIAEKMAKNENRPHLHGKKS